MDERRPFKAVKKEAWIGGVCAGLAYAYGLPVLWLRVAAILLFVAFSNSYVVWMGAAVFWVYVILWIFAPQWKTDPADYEARTT
jgi:phage shock protein PspC (stress-responsive transcriptional regulator)